MPILIQNMWFMFSLLAVNQEKGHTSGLTKEINKLRGEGLDIII